MKALEKNVEAKIGRLVKKLRGRYYKFTSPSRRGVADRLILFPGGKICFLEVKRWGELPTAQQKKFIKDMQKMGFHATWVDNFEDAQDFFNEVLNHESQPIHPKRAPGNRNRPSRRKGRGDLAGRVRTR